MIIRALTLLLLASLYTGCANDCGDGYQDPDEQCDDGNQANGDGCSDACGLEEVVDSSDASDSSDAADNSDASDSSDPADSSDASDSSDPADNSDASDSSDPADNSDASDSTEPTTPTELGCGNGIIEEGETCDDGNLITEACDYGETSCLICNILCQEVPGETRYCGDDIIQIDFDEQCDDGVASETCSDTCIASEEYIPDPEEVAPKIEQSSVPTFLEKNKFLFDSSAPVQKDASPTIFDANRIGVMRGTVETEDGQPLSGVRVSIVGHSEYGYTLTRANGGYDLAVNGGKKWLVAFQKQGYLKAQRRVEVRWNNYQSNPTAVLRPIDTVANPVELGSNSVQVAEGTPVIDHRGERQSRLLIPPGTTGNMRLADGTTAPIGSATLRSTEYTAGSAGLKAMPGNLPSTSAYTYAVELSLDEAEAAGALSVEFDSPVFHYVENFLGVPVGEVLPVGYYDTELGYWIASQNGVVVEILEIVDGMATIDADGDGLAEDETAEADLFITQDEKTQLAQLYAPGQTIWRVPLEHFTPVDINFSQESAEGSSRDRAQADSDGNDPSSPDNKDPCEEEGSIILCESQVLGETIPLNGLGYNLNYRSDRGVGRSSKTINLELLDEAPSEGIVRVEVTIGVGGQTNDFTLTPEPNLTLDWTWDGLDGYGRKLNGIQKANIAITYYYESWYVSASDGGNAFGSLPELASSLGSSWSYLPEEGLLGQTQNYYLNVGAPDFWKADGLGSGGWSLDPHHVYQPDAKTLFLGNGTTQPADRWIVMTKAGTGEKGGTADAGVATEIDLWSPQHLAVLPDGSFYLTQLALLARLVYVDAEGNRTVVAPESNPGDLCSDNYRSFGSLAYDGSSNLYFTMDDYNGWGLVCRYHIETNTVHHVAGDLSVSTACETGDVDSITLGSSLQGITVGPSGNIYFSDTQGDCVRRIGLDGTVEKIAGGGSVNPTDGMDARDVRLITPKGLFVTDAGEVYFADAGLNQVLQVATDGTTAVVADLFEPRDVVVSDEGYIYVTNINNVYRVSPSGEQDIVMGRTGYVWQEYASSTYVYTPNLVELELSPDHSEQNPSILVGTAGYNSNNGHRVYRLGSPYSYYDEGYHYVPSGDGHYYYTFDEEGRHLFTKQLLTGVTVWTFGYDSNGRLSSLADRMGRVTTVEHDIDGNITGIVTPNNVRTEITTDSNGLISSVTSPTAKTYSMVYDQTDLLTFLRGPANNEHTYEYNEDGRLIADTRPNTGTISLSRTGTAQNYTVTKTSPEGRVTTYGFIADSSNDGGIKTISYSNGSQMTMAYEGVGSRTVTYPSGIEHEMVYAPDPRFGMQLPYVAESTITYPSGESFTTETEREVELENVGAVFDMVTVTDTIVEAGIRSLTVVQDAAQRTVTQTTGEGRQVVATFDELGRISGVQRSEGAATGSDLAALSFTYDDDTGLLSQVQRGDQYFEYAYDSQGRVISRTDALGRTVDYAYNDDNLISQLTLADGNTQFEYGYDDLGRRTSYIMPNGGAHTLNHTFDGRLGEYAAPATTNPLSKSYDLDSRITAVTHPTGRSILYSRNGQHRLEAVSYDEGEVSVTFSAVSTDIEPETMTVTPTDSDATAQTLAFIRDGSRLTNLTGSGGVPFEASYEYNQLGNIDALTFSIDGYSHSATMSHDSDGYQTVEDDITQDRSGPTGAPASISDANGFLQTYSYDEQGFVVGKVLSLGADELYSLALGYDAGGYPNQREDTLEGTSTFWSLSYSNNGELESVSSESTVLESYTYDDNGNRTGLSGESASYDARDRLTNFGSTTYSFDDDGFLTSRTDGSSTDTFSYSVRGELLRATVSGEDILFEYDPFGRRIRRTSATQTVNYYYTDPNNAFRVSGFMEEGGDFTRVSYDGLGHAVRLSQGTSYYYIATDQVGSVRGVFDDAGTLVKSIAYNAIGEILDDSNPDFFMPLGFGGGIRDAGLVRMGYRDYDAELGRWTATDPILFKGKQANLYVYAANNPISLVDPLGLICIEASAYEGVGGGARVCWNDDGWSICAEGGVGVGFSVGITNGALDSTGHTGVAEVSAGCGALAGVGAGLELTVNPCGDLDPTGKGSIEVLGNKLEGKTDGTVEYSTAIGGDLSDAVPTDAKLCGVSAKLALRGCGQF